MPKANPPPAPAPQVNTEIVAIQRAITPAGEAQLRGLIAEHAAKTGSARAKALLANWEASKAKFWQLVPPAEKVRRLRCLARLPCLPCLPACWLAFWGEGVQLAPPLVEHFYGDCKMQDDQRALVLKSLTLHCAPPDSLPQNTPEANPAIEWAAEAKAQAQAQVAATA